jgi:hypothetical protein
MNITSNKNNPTCHSPTHFKQNSSPDHISLNTIFDSSSMDFDVRCDLNSLSVESSCFPNPHHSISMTCHNACSIR